MLLSDTAGKFGPIEIFKVRALGSEAERFLNTTVVHDEKIRFVRNVSHYLKSQSNIARDALQQSLKNAHNTELRNLFTYNAVNTLVRMNEYTSHLMQMFYGSKAGLEKCDRNDLVAIIENLLEAAKKSDRIVDYKINGDGHNFTIYTGGFDLHMVLD